MSVSPVVGQPPILIMHSIFMDISQTNWDAHPSSLMNSHKFFWIPMFNGMNETYQETMTLEPPKYGELFEYLKFYLYPQSPVLHPPPQNTIFNRSPNFLEKSLLALQVEDAVVGALNGASEYWVLIP